MPTTDPGKLRAKLARARPRRNAHLRQWYVANHAAQFEAKKAEQENRCAGCKRSFDTPGVRAVVDHRLVQLGDWACVRESGGFAETRVVFTIFLTSAYCSCIYNVNGQNISDIPV
jgi:hypothetical protein